MVQAYFHRCKSHYQKLYGTDSGYSHTLLKLLPQIDKRRLNKMVEDVKEVNPFFSSYLEGKQISRLKEEDVEQFEAAFPVDEDLGKAHWLDFMVIRIGFMMVLEKSEQIYANCFQC